jgi:hypothetical protein
MNSLSAMPNQWKASLNLVLASKGSLATVFALRPILRGYDHRLLILGGFSVLVNARYFFAD